MSSETMTPAETGLDEIIDGGSREALAAAIEAMELREVGLQLSRLGVDRQARFLTLLPPDTVAGLLAELPEAQASDLIGLLPPEDAAPILSEMVSADTADLLGTLDEEHAEEIISEMEPEAAQDARLLTGYAGDVAGGLMLTEYLAYPQHYTCRQVIGDMRDHSEEYSSYSVQYVYVIDDERRLAGVLPLRDLLLTSGNTPVAEIMIKNPVHVLDTTHLDALADFFRDYGFIASPVVNAGRVLLGIVRRSDVEEALGDRAQSDLLKMQGIVGGEELRSMPTFLRARRRFSWLSINILLNLGGAGVVAFYQDTLEAVIALAVFLPIISDMSGCTGSQAFGVTMREMTLGLLKPHEFLRVWWKEATVGIMNGVVLGFLIAVLAFVWKGNPYLGIVAGGALALNSLVAVIVGGSIPMVLKLLRQDPALAGGPILTTITDMGGFFLVLSLANALLPYLT